MTSPWLAPGEVWSRFPGEDSRAPPRLTSGGARARSARAFIVLQGASILLAWALAQAPYLVPPNIAIEGSASPPEVMASLLITYFVGGLVLLPSLAILFHVFKGRNPAEA